MEKQRIVSFKVAKAIKEAGYPQGEYDVCIDSVTKPTYIDVWLWLIRIKEINLSPIYWNSDTSWHIAGFIKDRFNDPEEAIIAAIEYIVDNNLLK